MQTLILCFVDTRYEQSVSWLSKINACIMDARHKTLFAVDSRLKYGRLWIQDINIVYHSYHTVSSIPDIVHVYHGHLT